MKNFLKQAIATISLGMVMLPAASAQVCQEEMKVIEEHPEFNQKEARVAMRCLLTALNQMQRAMVVLENDARKLPKLYATENFSHERGDSRRFAGAQICSDRRYMVGIDVKPDRTRIICAQGEWVDPVTGKTSEGTP